MLRTRLLVGSLLAGAAFALLLLDQPPLYPGWLLVVLSAGLAATHELATLCQLSRPRRGLCYLSVAALLGANWLPALATRSGEPSPIDKPDHWTIVILLLALVVLAGFLLEMAQFRQPGGVVQQLAVSVWVAVYLGVLPSFLVQLRWQGGPEAPPTQGLAALLLALFVPKAGDIGAYAGGRLWGRRALAPVLSPQKTWEGAICGLLSAALAAVLLDHLGPCALLGGRLVLELAFGLSLGLAGMLGDLAESLIKRDCCQKDASQLVPGFGGVLDVLDALLLAAPVAYTWFALLPKPSPG